MTLKVRPERSKDEFSAHISDAMLRTRDLVCLEDKAMTMAGESCHCCFTWSEGLGLARSGTL